MTYVAETHMKLAQEVNLQEELAREAKEKAELGAWARIMAYLTNKRENITLEAKLHLKLASEANIVREVDHTLDQMLDCIYDDEPLGFEKEPVASTKICSPRVRWRKSI